MRRASIHLHAERPGQVDSSVLEWRTGSDTRGRKWSHFLRRRAFVCALARDARVDDVSDELQALQDPEALAELAEDMFGAGVELFLVEVAHQSFDVGVIFGEDDGIFHVVVDVGVDESAPDTDEAIDGHKGIVRAKFEFPILPSPRDDSDVTPRWKSSLISSPK